MAQIWRPQSPDVHKHWVQTIIDEASDELTPWEIKFISDIEIKLANGWQLTQAQEKKLESIYAERTS